MFSCRHIVTEGSVYGQNENAVVSVSASACVVNEWVHRVEWVCVCFVGKTGR